jgi:hypothetical protein
MNKNLSVSPMLSRFLGRVLFTALAATLIHVSPQNARADLLLDFTGGNANTFGNNATVGWEFTLSSPVLLNSLGFWDNGSDGLINSHEVGIWNSANPATVLASTMVTSASTPVASSSPTGRWLFNGIPSLVLSPGTYVVGATIVNGDPDLQRFSATASLFPGATFVQSRDIGAPGLAYPSPAPVFNDGIFGPNLQVSAIPEPASAVILLCGMICCVRRRLTRLPERNT